MKSYQKILNVLSRELVSIGDLKITWGEIVGALFLSIILVFFFLVSRSFWIINLLVIPAILIGYNKGNQLTQFQQKFLLSLTLAVILTYSIKVAYIGYKIVSQPPEWDFHLYWVYGQVGARFLNPYDPQKLLQFAQALNPSEAFLNELYFFQFPALIFLFLPLGWFDINTAAFLWYVFLLTVLILDIILLWSIFYKRADYKSLLLIALLLLVLESTVDTLGFTQINFIVLLAFLLYWQKRESVSGGIWLGIGMMVKPILLIVLIYPVLRRYWHSLLGVAIAIIVSSTITIIAFGPGMFFGYFVNNPIVHKMPNDLYTEGINQSLLATILRLTNFDFSNGSPYLQPIFIIAALLLAGITSYLVFHRKDEQDSYSDHALALTLVFALLLFPKTLTHYAVLLIVPILTIWTNRNTTNTGFWVVLTFITAEYVLVSLGGNLVFIAILIAWLFVAGICIKSLQSRHHKKS